MSTRTCPDWPQLMEIAPELQFKHYTVAELHLPADALTEVPKVPLTELAICCDPEPPRLQPRAHRRGVAAALRQSHWYEVRECAQRRPSAARASTRRTGVGGGPPRRAASTFSTTARVIASRVSCVALPMCGVRTTFGRPTAPAARAARARRRRARR